MMELFVHTRDGGDKAIVTVGVLKPKRSQVPAEWHTLLQTFLMDVASQGSMMMVLETPNPYDWFSEFCAERGIPITREALPNDFARLTVALTTSTQQEELVAAVVEDEVWQIGGLLTIRVGNGLTPTDVDPVADIRPIADGEAFEWLGPPTEIAIITDSLRRVCSALGVQLNVVSEVPWNSPR